MGGDTPGPASVEGTNAARGGGGGGGGTPALADRLTEPSLADLQTKPRPTIQPWNVNQTLNLVKLNLDQ